MTPTEYLRLTTGYLGGESLVCQWRKAEDLDSAYRIKGGAVCAGCREIVSYSATSYEYAVEMVKKVETHLAECPEIALLRNGAAAADWFDIYERTTIKKVKVQIIEELRTWILTLRMAARDGEDAVEWRTWLALSQDGPKRLAKAA